MQQVIVAEMGTAAMNNKFDHTKCLMKSEVAIVMGGARCDCMVERSSGRRDKGCSKHVHTREECRDRCCVDYMLYQWGDNRYDCP